MQRTIRINAALIALLFLLPLSCGKKMSDRDARREQIRANADAKREELTNIVGNYDGLITSDQEFERQVALKLEVRDIPYVEEGQIDPVMVPTLSGFFSLQFGETPDPDSSDNFEITKAEYDSKSSTLSLTVSHETYKDIIFSLKQIPNGLDGQWTAPHLQYTGKITLKKSAPEDLP